MALKPPRIILETRARIASLVYSAYIKFGHSCVLKAMKKDYAEKLITLLDIMLQGCTMQFEDRLCHVSGNLVRPLTVPEKAWDKVRYGESENACLSLTFSWWASGICKDAFMLPFVV